MDLSALDTRTNSTNGVLMPVRHPGTGVPLTNDDGSPWNILLLGSDSPEYQAAQRKLLDARVTRRRGPNNKPTVEEVEDDGIKLMTAATKGWNGLKENGQAIPFSTEKAAELYRRYPWLREQVSAFIVDRGNFMPTQVEGE